MSIDAAPPEGPGESVIEAVAAAAVARHTAAGSAHGRPVHSRCENCGTPLTGPFCPQCGQHDIDFHRSFGHMFLDALENFFHFDAKLFRNLVTLLFRPGRLTAEFNAGRRAAQMPPFRLYLFVSVLFFFVNFLGRDLPEVDAKGPTGRVAAAAALADLARETADPAAREKLSATAARLQEPAKKAPGESAAPKAEPAGGINVQVTDKKDATAFERFLIDQGRYAIDHQRELQESFLHALPRMLLVCLPVLALYTRFLFRRSGQVYLQHLILALHFHTFVYLWWLVAHGWTALLGLRFPGLAGFIEFASGVWLTLYPFLMLRRIFGQSRWRIFFKTLALAAAYTLTLALGFLLTAVVIVLTV